jgi:hypothetical protein
VASLPEIGYSLSSEEHTPLALDYLEQVLGLGVARE